MNELLRFTEAAVRHIKGMLAKEPGLGFRVSVKKTGCSGYSYAPTIVSQEFEGDLQFQLKEAFTVFVDPTCVDQVKGLTVDFIEENKEGGLKQKKLVFINPNEKSRCGCGESFHV